MKQISLSIPNPDYEVYKSMAKQMDRPVSELIREALSLYKEQQLKRLGRLERLSLFPDTALIETLPTREEIYDEVTERHD
jgi:Arc/MetJ-type ribon-helix-helix transcriptional regulator